MRRFFDCLALCADRLHTLFRGACLSRGSAKWLNCSFLSLAEEMLLREKREKKKVKGYSSALRTILFHCPFLVFFSHSYVYNLILNRYFIYLSLFFFFLSCYSLPRNAAVKLISPLFFFCYYCCFALQVRFTETTIVVLESLPSSSYTHLICRAGNSPHIRPFSIAATQLKGNFRSYNKREAKKKKH